MNTYADLLARWAARAPDECRANTYDDMLLGHYLRRCGGDFSAYIESPRGPDPNAYPERDRALILWHVLACARRRGLQPDLCHFSHSDEWEGSHYPPGPDGYATEECHEARDACPALAALASYVAALETLAARVPASAPAP